MLTPSSRLKNAPSIQKVSVGFLLGTVMSTSTCVLSVSCSFAGVSLIEARKGMSFFRFYDIKNQELFWKLIAPPLWRITVISRVV
jgi:hypothetical protein